MFFQQAINLKLENQFSLARNFQKSKFRQEQNEKIQNLNYEQKHVVLLAYTSLICSGIEIRSVKF